MKASTRIITLCNTSVLMIKTVSKFGQGALMAKFDVESTYRNLSVHAHNRYVIGMKWRSMF